LLLLLSFVSHDLRGHFLWVRAALFSFPLLSTFNLDTQCSQAKWESHYTSFLLSLAGAKVGSVFVDCFSKDV